MPHMPARRPKHIGVSVSVGVQILQGFVKIGKILIGGVDLGDGRAIKVARLACGTVKIAQMGVNISNHACLLPRQSGVKTAVHRQHKVITACGRGVVVSV